MQQSQAEMDGSHSDSDNDSVILDNDVEELGEAGNNMNVMQNIMESGAAGESNVLIPCLMSIQEQLKKLTRRIDHPEKGLMPKVKKIGDQADDNSARILQLELENEKLRNDQRIMMGILQKQSDEISRLKSKSEDSTGRSMWFNILIHNYEYDADPSMKDLRPVFMGFLRKKMSISADAREVWVAHRLSPNSNIIVAKVNPALKNDIYENIGRLKNVKNSKDEPIFITEQQPEGLRARKKDARDSADIYKEEYKHLPADQQPKVEVRKDRVYVNKDWMRNPCDAPTPTDMLDVEPEELDKLEKIKFSESKECGEKGSTFRALGTKVSSRAEMRRGYKQVRRLYPHATHVMCGYVFKKPGSDKMEYGKQDDGEWGGSHRILEFLKVKKCANVAVFVVREFGGEHIGPNRFNHIRDCTEQVLKRMNAI